jgi:hypothetical protein
MSASEKAALVHMLRSRESGLGSSFTPGMGLNKRTAQALERRGFVAMTGPLPAGLHDTDAAHRAWSATLTESGVQAAQWLQGQPEREADAERTGLDTLRDLLKFD